ncbi:MAG: hypothetical protein ABI729_00475 [Chitinophagales bacterium]
MYKSYGSALANYFVERDCFFGEAIFYTEVSSNNVVEIFLLYSIRGYFQEWVLAG